jgi:ABC-type polysaccharide/polyol phosphate transport system ATPase subunit
MSSLILEDVYVHFPIFGSQPSLRKALYERSIGGLIGKEARRKNRVVVKALEAISLDLKDGDRFGLVGHNGAGKSTLLRVMAGIYEPISGIVRASGRITPLLEILPALDGEDTGYDNIVSSGLMLGMSNAQVQGCISDIEEFTELGEYLTLPVRTYSAGMLTRLGFALATAIEPDILLIDEGIGAGDQRFAEKAERRLNSLVGRSRILVLSSHSDGLIHQFCNKVALLQEGRIIALGPPDEVIAQYHNAAASALLTPQPNEILGIHPASLPENESEIDAVPETQAGPGVPAEALPPTADGAAESLPSEIDAVPETQAGPGVPAEALPPTADGAAESLPIDIAINDALSQLTSLYYARASKFATGGNFVEALRDLQKSLDFSPGNILALMTVGQIETSAGSIDTAKEYFNRVLEIEPDHEGAITSLAVVSYMRAVELEKAEDYREAWTKFEEGFALLPDNIAVVLLGARLKGKLGVSGAAADLYQRALEIEPSNEEAIAGLAGLSRAPAAES